jgi:hypothetical protein
MVAKSRESARLEGLVRNILNYSESQAGERTVKRAQRYLSSISRVSYAGALRSLFDRRQLHEIIRELQRVLPDLNRRVFAETELARLAEIAASFGEVLQPGSFEGRHGHTLRGFYINDNSMLKRPLICVNTAHHRVGVAAAFWHEMGHHLSRAIFGEHRGQLNMSLAAGYQDHLTNPEEIVADMVLALGGYPKTVAERLFDGSPTKETDPDICLLIPKASEHLRSIRGPDLQSRVEAAESLQVMAGMIHTAKLRAALLGEYDI